MFTGNQEENYKRRNLRWRGQRRGRGTDTLNGNPRYNKSKNVINVINLVTINLNVIKGLLGEENNINYVESNNEEESVPMLLICNTSKINKNTVGI